MSKATKKQTTVYRKARQIVFFLETHNQKLKQKWNFSSDQTIVSCNGYYTANFTVILLSRLVLRTCVQLFAPHTTKARLSAKYYSPSIFHKRMIRYLNHPCLKGAMLQTYIKIEGCH